MTWDELIKKARVWLGEAGSHGAIVERRIVELTEDDDGPTPWETTCLLQELALGLSDLHEACQVLLIGLDALAVAWGELLPEEKAEGVVL